MRWDAKDVFPGGECDVIRWGAGKTNYAWTWIKTDTKEARKDFSWGADKAESCLGPTWVKSRLPGVTGLGDRFSTAGNPTVVDIRILRELTDTKTWQTSLTVGPAVNRDGK